MKAFTKSISYTIGILLGFVLMTSSCIVHEHYGHHGQQKHMYKKKTKRMPPGQVKKYYGIHPKHQKKGKW
ncbi:hypothetical protein [Echinicola sediminis]